MATQYKFLTLEVLQDSTVFTTVWDKVGNKFFKLIDNNWADEKLNVVATEQLFARKVKLYNSFTERA